MSNWTAKLRILIYCIHKHLFMSSESYVGCGCGFDLDCILHILDEVGRSGKSTLSRPIFFTLFNKGRSSIRKPDS